MVDFGNNDRSAMRGLWTALLRGAAAGMAGTTALNAVTFGDMVIRARPASTTPQGTVEALADRAGVSVPGQGEERENRIDGLGPLTGIAAGVGAGALLGLVRAAGCRPGPLVSGLLATFGALLAGNAPMTLLGVADPRTWSAKDWVADLVPHLSYGVVTAAVLDGLDRT